MITDLVIDDISKCNLLENKSSIYYNGSIWETRKCGKCEIVGLLEKHNNYHVYIVKFDDGTLIKARHSNIKNGTVNNPYSKNICGVACSGRIKSVGNNFLYKHWQQMIYRCYDKKHISFKNYGARGIKVCNRWLCFEYFLNDITNMEGYEKLKNGHLYQIDRIDNNENYSLNNCHIVSCKDNSRNRRNNVFIKVKRNGVIEDIGHLIDISNKYNLSRTTIKRRIRNKSIINGLEFLICERKEYEEYETYKRRVTKSNAKI